MAIYLVVYRKGRRFQPLWPQLFVF